MRLKTEKWGYLGVKISDDQPEDNPERIGGAGKKE